MNIYIPVYVQGIPRPPTPNYHYFLRHKILQLPSIIQPTHKSKRMYFFKVYTYCIISLVNLDPMDKILFHGRLQLTFH